MYFENTKHHHVQGKVTLVCFSCSFLNFLHFQFNNPLCTTTHSLIHWAIQHPCAKQPPTSTFYAVVLAFIPKSHPPMVQTEDRVWQRRSGSDQRCMKTRADKWNRRGVMQGIQEKWSRRGRLQIIRRHWIGSYRLFGGPRVVASCARQPSNNGAFKWLLGWLFVKFGLLSV